MQKGQDHIREATPLLVGLLAGFSHGHPIEVVQLAFALVAFVIACREIIDSYSDNLAAIGDRENGRKRLVAFGMLRREFFRGLKLFGFIMIGIVSVSLDSHPGQPMPREAVIVRAILCLLSLMFIVDTSLDRIERHRLPKYGRRRGDRPALPPVDIEPMES